MTAIPWTAEQVEAMTRERTPVWVDEHMPPHGSCGFCGDPDARHRVLDAVAGRIRAGDSARSVADDYDLPLRFVARIAREWKAP